ncbi:MAG: CoA transferase [Chloroflexi bacterium]|nr:CoA transferase [Chloroflexota bacterium]
MAPLDGVRVVAVEQAVAGPLCTRMLADLGAEVIKIEPLGGDFARQWDSTAGGLSSYFVWLNRGKKSIAVDIGSESGHDILSRLIATADAIVHNMAPDAARRRGLDLASLQSFEGLVACTISGYGDNGPFGNRKAYDLLVQGETGIVALTGTVDAPAKVGLPVCDIGAGMYAANAVLAGLLRRARSGHGAQIEVTMFDAMVDWLGGPLTAVANGAEQPERVGMRHNLIVPYGPFKAQDGEWVVLAIQNQREWRTFCDRVLVEPQLIDDPRFCSVEQRLANRHEMEALIERTIGLGGSAEWFVKLEANRIAYGRLNDLSQLLAHPQLRHRDLLEVARSGGVSTPTVAPAIRWPGHVRPSRVPTLGEDTDGVLSQAGYDAAAISRLRADRVVR